MLCRRRPPSAQVLVLRCGVVGGWTDVIVRRPGPSAANGLALSRDTPVWMRGLVIVSRDDHGVAHDGSVGVSPEGWLPDRVSVGALTRAFPPELVDRVVDTTDTREVRRRLLPARLVVYFVLALWLFRGPNCGYGRVMVKLVDALYHRRRGRQLLEGVLDPDGWVMPGQGRRWRPPNISTLSRARTRLGADPLHMLFDAGRRPGRRPGRGGGVLLRAAGGVGGWLHHRRAQLAGERRVFRAARRMPPGTGRSRRSGGWPRPSRAPGRWSGPRSAPTPSASKPWPWTCCPAFGPGMLVLADRNFLSHTLARDVLATGAHILWRASASFRLTPIAGAGRRQLPGRAAPAAQGRRAADHGAGHRVHRAHQHGRRQCWRDSAGAEDSSEVFALVTDLLDPEAYPALDLACAYPMRWEAETVIGHHKTDMGQGMAVLRSKDPEGVAQEMWALFAVYQAIHTLIGAAVDATGIPPEKVSFPHALAAATDSVTAGFPPSPDLTWPWPPSCSRSSTRDSSSATGPTGPAHGPPRRPATSPPAKINPASSASPADYRSTASDPDPQAKRKAIALRGRPTSEPRRRRVRSCPVTCRPRFPA